jgi:hypothetical protein
MFIFNLSIQHLWGRVLVKYHQVRVIEYVDDSCIKVRLRFSLEDLSKIKHVLKEDAGLDLNISKISVLPRVSRILLHTLGGSGEVSCPREREMERV